MVCTGSSLKSYREEGISSLDLMIQSGSGTTKQKRYGGKHDRNDNTEADDYEGSTTGERINLVRKIPGSCIF